MGDSEITVARNYLEGAGGAFKGIDALPLTGQMTHYSVNKDTGKPDYVPDSAATGTAWATGVKTYDNAVVGRPHGKAVPDPARAGQEDRAARPATSPPRRSRTRPPPSRSATSAALLLRPGGHHRQLPRGGQGERRPGLDQRAAARHPSRRHPRWRLGDLRRDRQGRASGPGKTLEQQAKDRGYNYITAKNDLAGVSYADQKKPLLGLFSPGNMPVKFAPLLATPGGANGPAATCQPEPTFSTVPDLGR